MLVVQIHHHSKEIMFEYSNKYGIIKTDSRERFFYFTKTKALSKDLKGFNFFLLSILKGAFFIGG